MPLLDVSDVLDDPDFATTMTVTRTSSGTPVGGLSQLTSVDASNVVAVVQPAGSNDLNRMIEVENLSGAIVIYTTYRLIATAPGVTADIVTWRGRRYTVHFVDDWTEFGAGYVRALAGMTSLS